MYALEICAQLKKDLNDKIKNGEVHSVFDTSFNIVLDKGRLVTVAHASRPINHYSVIVPHHQSFKLKGVRQGQKVDFFPLHFEIKELGMRIDLKSAAIWDSTPTLSFVPAPSEVLQKKMELLADFLTQEGHREGIYPLLQFLLEDWPTLSSLFSEPLPFTEKETVIKAPFLHFMSLYTDYYGFLFSLDLTGSHLLSNEETLKEIHWAASSIIGFGLGLTPHMDDFLAGLMSASVYTSIYGEEILAYFLSLNQAIIRASESLTTKVSSEMLRYTSEGKTNKALRDVLENIFNERKSPPLRFYLRKVNELGASSGTDTLLGVYMGIAILLQNLNDLSARGLA